MDFVKMEGLGNDFVVVRGPYEPDAETVAAWCDRRHGIGADGVLVVTPVDVSTVRMGYWNADGSPAEMCGNGLRCVARYAVDNTIEKMIFVGEFSRQMAAQCAAVDRSASVLAFDDVDELLSRMALLEEVDVLLVKGSRSARMERVVSALTKRQNTHWGDQ